MAKNMEFHKVEVQRKKLDDKIDKEIKQSKNTRGGILAQMRRRKKK